jgi:hypothetical protein
MRFYTLSMRVQMFKSDVVKCAYQAHRYLGNGQWISTFHFVIVQYISIAKELTSLLLMPGLWML